MPSPRVAIVDIGSNSIKVLVAERRSDGQITAVLSKTLDARISAGIGQNNPRLTAESMARGIDAIEQLLLSAAPHTPERILLVATSAVRDAENGAEFRERVLAATGYEIRILSGVEEADLIGRGLMCDPALTGLTDFYIFDLGGGSLECLAFRARQIQTAKSLQLGCVRLTEKWVPDSAQAIDSATLHAIQNHTRAELTTGGFLFNLPPGTTAVGTGGTITTVRAILAAREGKQLEETDTRVPVDVFRSEMQQLSRLPLTERKRVAGLPPGRADVFPAALATLVAIAEAGRFHAYQHSLYNLRFGLAAEALNEQ